VIRLSIDVVALEERLNELTRAIPGVTASALLSMDGLPIATALPSNIDEEMVARIGVIFLSLSERLSSEFTLGRFRIAVIQGDAGYIIATSISEDAMLLVLASTETRLGLAMIETKRIANEIAMIMGRRPR